MKVRIGIDVGGTFTDVVVVDNESFEMLGQLKIPTTHRAKEGVALGIVDGLRQAMEKLSLDPASVAFIAHSTTQATNALLEGDVAKVGIVGIGSGIEGILARRATRVPPISLTAVKGIEALHRFVRWKMGPPPLSAGEALADLKRQGVEVIVASEAFGVDRTEREDWVVSGAKELGMLATSGHEVSGLYGLRVRTRTAAINAAILPRMIETAEMTERCVQSSDIRAPLMIMRSDGGVMSVAEVRRRPILTMLSGPAAGIAGALMHERISDGIFIEVGGTSADISVIRDGAPAMRPARLNGHRMYLNTLDVRTLGIAGGSMVRIIRSPGHPAGRIAAGPRSAHIAGCGYTCFADPGEIAQGKIRLIRPSPGDSDDHVVVEARSGRLFALTTTCAANFLGYVQAGHFALGSREAAREAFRMFAELNGSSSSEELARQALMAAARIMAPVLEALISEYQLDRSQVVLVGGGGGAAALVPFTAETMGLEHRIARNAEVISPLGVAMAMVRDTVERNIVDPKPADVLRVRREATEAVISAGAAAETVEVHVEVDKRRNLVRATAMGTTELRRKDESKKAVGEEECRQAAARSMHVGPGSVRLLAQTSGLRAYAAACVRRRMFGLFRRTDQSLRVLDNDGVVRLQRGAARAVPATVANVKAELMRAVDLLTDYGDAGRTIPDVFLLYGSRIANLSGLAGLDQVLALADAELRSLDPETPIVVISCSKQP